MTKNIGSSSRQKTDYIKGVAILTVVINHFANVYVTDSAGGYANGMISVFFILSGYGIFFSLSKGLQTYSLNRLIVTYWQKRFLRIYPLLWIYLFFEHTFQLNLMNLLALDFFRPAIPWFVPAILQCYIIAPFFFLLLRKFGLKSYCVVLLTGFIALNLILFYRGIPNVSAIAYHGYHGFFFSHILLFGAGLVIAHLSSLKQKTLSNVKVCFITLLFALLLHETTPQTNIHFSGSIIILEVFFLLFSILCVYSILNSTIYLPFSRLFQGLGVYSYSIYLFHRYYFKGVQKIVPLERYDLSLESILIVILLLPLFLASLAYCEEIINGVVNRNFNLKDLTRKYYSNVSFKKGQ